MGSAVISGIWLLSRGKQRTKHGGPGCGSLYLGGPGCGSLYLNRLRTVTMGRALCRAGAGTVLRALELCVRALELCVRALELCVR